MIQEGLYATLAADSGVSAIVGAKIYPVIMPQSAYTDSGKFPCIIYKVDGRDRQRLFSGTQALVSASVSVECYATTYVQSQDLAAAVRGALVDYSGTMTGTGSPVSSNVVKRIFIDSESEAIATEPGLYIVMQDYTIWYCEA